VGKTSIMMRYFDKVFSDTPLNTMGVDHKVKSLRMHNKKIWVMMTDTAG